MDTKQLPWNISRESFENQSHVLKLFKLGLLDHGICLVEVVDCRLGDFGLKDAHVCDQWSVAILGVLNVLSLESIGEFLLVHLVTSGQLGVTYSTVSEGRHLPCRTSWSGVDAAHPEMSDGRLLPNRPHVW